MTRARIPIHQHRRIDPGSQCLCHIGDFKCHLGRDCPFGETEMACEDRLDATRPFPPPYEELPRGRTLAWTILALALIAAGLLMLLRPVPAHSEAFVILVGPR